MSDQNQPASGPDQLNIYHIRIKERLEEQWQDWFEGMTITHEDNGDTIITAQIIDQAQLFGLLKRVRNLGLTLISVTRANLEDNQ